MIAVRLGALAALVVALYGQPQPEDAKLKDLGGWDKIRWGMTMAEVRAAYGIDTEPETKDGWTLLQLKPVKIGGVEMGVQVGARQDAGKIASVKLWSYFGIPTAGPSAGPQDFDTLRTILIEKYGAPASEESKRGENFRLIKTVLWTFPSTSVQMTLEQSSSLPSLGNIFVEYTATGK
ncbi:MAG: hypothetical protein ACLPWF_07090 [Bryobacteraceae bacterium]